MATAPRQAILSRVGRITDWKLDMILSAAAKPGKPEERWSMLYVEIEGEFTEPVAGVTAFSITLHPTERVLIGRAEAPAVGAFTKARPVIRGSIEVSHLEFDTIVTLASTGHLVECTCDLQEPRRGRGLITSLSISARGAGAASKGRRWVPKVLQEP